MFEDERLTGFFDFYFAGWTPGCFDLAVCLNDWCIDLPTAATTRRVPRPAGRLPGRAPLTAAERAAAARHGARWGAAFLDLAPVGLPTCRAKPPCSHPHDPTRTLNAYCANGYSTPSH